MAVNVAATTPRVQYVASAAQTVFTVPFVFYANADLQVYKNSVLLTLGVDYTLTGAGVAPSGSMTLTSGAALNDVVTIIRASTISRTSQYPTTGAFPVDALNTDLGKLTSWMQELQVGTNRGLQLPATDTLTSMTIPSAASRASQVLGFDSGGNAIAVQPSSAIVAAAMQPVVAAATLAAGRTALGVGYGSGLKSDGAGNATLDINTLTAKATAVSNADKLAIHDVAGAALKSILLNQAGRLGAIGSNLVASLATCAAGNMASGDNVPQSSQGTQVLSASITPRDANSTLLVLALINGAASSALNTVAALFRDATAAAVIASEASVTTIPQQIVLMTTVSAASVAATTFKINVGTTSAGTFYFNGSGAGTRILGGVNSSFLLILEILP